MEAKGALSNSFYEASIILKSKPDKDITRKENYRPLSFTKHIDAKILNKIPTNQIPQYTKKNYIPQPSGIWKSINETHINWLKKKNHIVLSDAEKAFDKVQHTFMIKNILIKLGREKLLQLDKEYLLKKIIIATASSKKLDAFHLKIRSKKRKSTQ